MRKKKYIILVMLLLFMVGGITAYKYVYKQHRNVAEAETEFVLSATNIRKAFDFVGVEQQKYVDRVVQIKGTITEKGNLSLVLENKVQVNFLTEPGIEFQLNEHITIKGRCVGYDDLLELVKIDQATAIH